MDFILYPITGSLAKSKFSLFYDLKTQITNTSFDLSTGVFEEIYTSSFLTGNASLGYKMMSKQGWSTIKKNGTNTFTFSNYSAEGGLNPILLQYEKSYLFPNFSWSYFRICGNYNYSNYVYQTYEIPKKFVNGDFNGDGLTDVVAIEGQLVYTAACDRIGYRDGGQTYLVNLDKRIADSSLINTGVITPSTLNNYMVYDFNGDGKSDLYVFNYQSFKVYSLNDSNQFEQLYASSDTDILNDRPVLMGDYNGDGKTDFILPIGVGNYYAKYISTGTSYVKTFQTYPVYYTTPSSSDYKPIIPNDINHDGKTDLVVAGSTNQILPGNDYKYISVKNYKNNGDNFELESSVQTSNMDAVQSNAIPIFLDFDRNNPLIEINFISGSSIYNFASKKDFSKEKLLRTVTNGNKVVETITYNGLVIEPCSYNCKPTYAPTTPVENYPNLDIQVAPGFQVVSQLEKQSASVYKKQLFAYYGAVSNVEGLGFLGFKSSMRTNWHDDSSSNQIISTVSKFDTALRGANTENYTVLYYASPYSSFAPTDYISKSILSYNTAADALLPNKVFKLQNINTKQYNGLDPTNTETSITYDSYNNPTQSVSVTKEGSSLVQTSTTNLTYAVPTSYPYVVGRPTAKTQTQTLSNSVNSSTSTESYSYTNHLLTQVQKSASASTDIITETNSYDGFGNIIQKSISATSLSPRNTYYQYDASGRFLTQSTDIEGLSTTFNYNTSNGLLTSETNPYGLTTSYFYDVWFRKIKTTDYLGKSKTIGYTRSGNNTSITADGDDSSQTVDYFDDLGRKYKSSTKDIGGVLSSVDYGYDIYDRNYKVSEPYYGSATQWNTTEYDVYGRVVKTTSFTGKTVTMSYSGLSTTVDDGVKTKTSVKNAIGKVVSMTDNPGGTITYTYFANGNLETSNYGGATTVIVQDGWGRKTKLMDSSAGTYDYSYNSFGETLTEKTPNGLTTYTLNSVGKLIKKTIKGTSTDPNNLNVITTDSETLYTYDTVTKLLQSTVFTDNLNSGAQINTSYQYDSYKRLNQTFEQTPYVSFTKQLTYDAFGRINTESSTAQVLSNNKSSSKTIKHVYANGFPWQILDNTTLAVLWQTNTVNSRGQLVNATLGNGITISNTYDTYGLISQTQHNLGSVNTMTLNTVFDAQRGNLTSRNNNLFNNWSENFTYDQQDRLLNWKDGNGTTIYQTYDDRGRITTNNLGSYIYSSSTPYKNTSIQSSPEGTNYYLNRPTQIVSYNAFKSPVEIDEVGTDKVSFTYNDGNVRAAMFYGGLGTKETRRYRKYYSADGSMEIKLDTQNNATEFITYIAGDGYSAPLLVKSDGVTQNYLYLHRDYQGSILAITNQAGTIVEKRLFDAWGSLINYYNATGAAFGSWGAFDRGYTGHEHLISVGLINMNARLYDPKLHRFLQPDNYIQEPFNTQNYNRYAYCVNNPLKHTDISGNFFWMPIIIGAIIGGMTSAYQSEGNGGGAFLKGMIVGGLTGLVGAGVGNVVAGGTFFGSSMATAVGFQAGFISGAAAGAAGAFTAGAVGTWLNGGNLGEGLSAGLNAVPMGIVTGGVMGGISGGINAKSQGLDFWSGNGTNVMKANDFPLLDDGSESVEYSNNSARRFSNSHSELNRLSSNVDNLYADGTIPKDYSMKNGFIITPKGEEAYGLTTRTGGWFNKTTNVYLSKAAFFTRAQLYVTMHHEYMHAYFYTIGNPFSKVAEHKIINQWTLDQSKAWNIGVNYDPKLSSGYPGFHYSRYGFKIIQNLP